MPYIAQNVRRDVHAELTNLAEGGLAWCPANAGELNFVVSTFIANYLRAKGLKYAHVNEMVGALECAKMELNRVVIGPYEDQKIHENGSVYSAIQIKDTY